jgi:hypothetical protein
MLVGCTDKCGKPVRMSLGVVVEQRYVLSMRNRYALVTGPGEAEVGSILDDRRDPGEARFHKRHRTVAAAVIDENRLKLPEGLALERGQTILEQLPAIEIRDYDRDAGFFVGLHTGPRLGS